MNDTSNGTAASGFTVALWRMAGFWACLWNGKLGRFSYYQRQAALETGHFRSRFFRDGGNAFGMHYSEYTRRADIGTPGDGGTMAVYSPSILWSSIGLGWANRYWRSWLDRFSWDDAQVPSGAISYDRWAKEVAYHGYKGGRAATQSDREGYYQALLGMKDDKDVVGAWFDDDGLPWVKILVTIVVLGITFIILRWVFLKLWRSKWVRKLRKG